MGKEKTKIEPRLLSLQDLCGYLNLGEARAKKAGEEAGAKIRFGKRVLYDKRKIDAYIDFLVNYSKENYGN